MSPRVLLALFACSLLSLAVGATAWSDDGKKKRRDGFDFGDQAPAPGTATEDPRRSAKGTGEPQDPIAAEVQRLAGWPDRRGKLAAEALFLRGQAAIPYLVQALGGNDPDLQPGAASVLGKIGEEVHVHTILTAAAKRSNGSKAREFFAAAYALSPKATKRWLISFLTLSNRPVFRSLAAQYLVDKVGPEDRARILDLLEAEKPSVRMAGLQLLRPAGVEDAFERLLQALSDIAPQVARKASLLLALESDPEVIERLNRVAREGDARERAYATLALAEMMRATPGNPFQEATLVELISRRGLRHPEKLTRSAAAVGLAYGALDASDPSLSGLLDSSVVEVLIDAVGGGHYRDYASLTDAVFASLRRLSGLDLPNTAVDWARWWQREKGRFRARRPLQSISAADLPQAYVRFESVEADGRRQWAEFVPVGGQRDDAFLLSDEGFRRLVDAVQDAGIFDAEDRREPRTDEHIALSLGVLNQRKQMYLTPSKDDVAYTRLKMRLTSLVEANIWQRFRDKDKAVDARTWWETNAPLMAQAAPDERAQMLQAAIVYAFDDLPDDEAREAALYLLEDMDARLTKAQARDLALALTQAASFGDLEARGLKWVVSRASPDVRDALIEAVAQRREPAAQRILARLLYESGVDRVREAFADPRSNVRRAAALGAREILQSEETAQLSTDELAALADRLRPGLQVLALDEVADVAVEALLGLVHLGDRSVVEKLEALYQGGNLSVKLAVTEALGHTPVTQSHAMLTRVLAEEREEGSEQLRAAALDSMARSGSPDAVRLLVFYLLNDPKPGVRATAGRVLAELGTADARFALVDPLTRGTLDAERRARLVDVLGQFKGDVVKPMLLRYLGDEAQEVVAVAALRAAEHNMGKSVPYLINLLRRGTGTQRENALRAMELLTSMRFEGTGYSLLAERYSKWYEANNGGDFKLWFRTALKEKGYDVGSLASYLAGERDPTPVPLLIRVLRDPDPVLRRNAAVALTEITGAWFGAVTRTTSLRDAAQVADQWARWWERQTRAVDAPGK